VGGNVWNPVLELLDDGYRAQVVEWWEAADLGLEILGGMRSRETVVAGWSLGGQVALRLAAESRFAGVVMVSSMVNLVKGESRPGVDPGVPRAIEGMLDRNRRAYLRAFFERCLSPVADPELVRLLLEESGKQSTELLVKGLNYMQEDAPVPADVPIALLHGLEDEIIPPACSGYVKELSGGNAEVEYLPGTGHMVPILEASVTAEKIDGFCRYRSS